MPLPVKFFAPEYLPIFSSELVLEWSNELFIELNIFFPTFITYPVFCPESRRGQSGQQRKVESREAPCLRLSTQFAVRHKQRNIGSLWKSRNTGRLSSSLFLALQYGVSETQVVGRSGVGSFQTLFFDLNQHQPARLEAGRWGGAVNQASSFGGKSNTCRGQINWKSVSFVGNTFWQISSLFTTPKTFIYFTFLLKFVARCFLGIIWWNTLAYTNAKPFWLEFYLRLGTVQ